MSSDRIAELIAAEADRQSRQLTLIPSENYASRAVLEANGSTFNNKYAEGYPGKRYYGGGAVCDELENEVIRLAQELFVTDYHVNVQPYSGSPANLAAYSAVLQPGDTVMALSLAQGGHLTHGHSVSITSKIYHFVQYAVSPDTEMVDYQEIARMAHEHKPKLIVCGGTAYPMIFDFAAFAAIAKEVGALFMVDMAHIAGLVAARVHPTPFGHADIITSTTHKTLRGPRSGIIFARPELGKAVDKAVFPGLQGGPHMHTIAAMGVAFQEALQPSFHQYGKQIVSNAKALAFGLQRRGIRLVAGGTDTHLILVDLRPIGVSGSEAQDRLDAIGLIANKNTIPFDPNPPMKPSGLRLGTPGVTTRGMKEKEMEQLAELIADCLTGERTQEALAEEVSALAKKFRIPSHH